MPKQRVDEADALEVRGTGAVAREEDAALTMSAAPSHEAGDERLVEKEQGSRDGEQRCGPDRDGRARCAGIAHREGEEDLRDPGREQPAKTNGQALATSDAPPEPWRRPR